MVKTLIYVLKCNKDKMVVVEINGGIRGSPRRFFKKGKKGTTSDELKKAKS
jgi:hypothetical protein